MGNSNQRKHLRLPELRYAALKVLHNGSVVNDQGFCLMLDLSLGGCKIRSPHKVGKGTTVILNVGFEEEIMTFPGKVRHSMPSSQGGWDLGIEFVDLTPRTKGFLRRILDSHPVGKG